MLRLWEHREISETSIPRQNHMYSFTCSCLKEDSIHQEATIMARIFFKNQPNYLSIIPGRSQMVWPSQLGSRVFPRWWESWWKETRVSWLDTCCYLLTTLNSRAGKPAIPQRCLCQGTDEGNQDMTELSLEVTWLCPGWEIFGYSSLTKNWGHWMDRKKQIKYEDSVV